jgi:ATP-dependent exoDNAse (exonuclease V) alpha subunit
LEAADRRDQALFRDGRHEQAIRGYAARDRVHIATEARASEDRALDAAQADREAGKSTIVIAQTSNEHLDQLNARAQAIRRQDGQLGPESLPVPGRPYALHPNDDVQIRRTISHPEHGQLRNGTSAIVTAIDTDMRSVRLRMADGREVSLDREQAARADLRLAYVQHPFPAQGHTTDTAHVIVGEHATREGTYVALTRAREQTHIHAADQQQPSNDRLAGLAERVSRTEPELPSIRTPLAHEASISREPDNLEQDTEPVPAPPATTIEQADAREPVTGWRRRWPTQPEPETDPLAAERDDHAAHRSTIGFEP